MLEVTMRVEIAEGAEDLPLPQYQTAGAAGMDLHANIEGVQDLLPGEQVLLPCGIKIRIAEGYEAQVRPRSGLAVREGVWAHIGTIDSDYRGEVHVLLRNFSDRPLRVRRGDRVAQMILSPVARAVLVEVPRLDETGRGSGGFGSTGLRAA